MTAILDGAPQVKTVVAKARQLYLPDSRDIVEGGEWIGLGAKRAGGDDFVRNHRSNPWKSLKLFGGGVVRKIDRVSRLFVVECHAGVRPSPGRACGGRFLGEPFRGGFFHRAGAEEDDRGENEVVVTAHKNALEQVSDQGVIRRLVGGYDGSYIVVFQNSQSRHRANDRMN